MASLHTNLRHILKPPPPQRARPREIPRLRRKIPRRTQRRHPAEHILYHPIRSPRRILRQLMPRKIDLVERQSPLLSP